MQVRPRAHVTSAPTLSCKSVAGVAWVTPGAPPTSACRPASRTGLISEEQWILQRARGQVANGGEAGPGPEEGASAGVAPDVVESLLSLIQRVGLDLMRAKFRTQLQGILDVLGRTRGQDPPDFGTFIGWHRVQMAKRREAAEKASAVAQGACRCCRMPGIDSRVQAPMPSSLMCTRGLFAA